MYVCVCVCVCVYVCVASIHTIPAIAAVSITCKDGRLLLHVSHHHIFYVTLHTDYVTSSYILCHSPP